MEPLVDNGSMYLLCRITGFVGGAIYSQICVQPIVTYITVYILAELLRSLVGCMLDDLYHHYLTTLYTMTQLLTP